MSIEFTAPLTLIVGCNGSGKTTIIECLKYAATGQLPPNSKGGAFIHDPKLSGEKEVLAQVKLGFRNANNKKLVIARSLSLTVTKTGVKQKALEGNLIMHNQGERTSMSSTVRELDTVVPQELGVSAAILDAVIFCHQDDSLWPMSEPSKLKLRFDEIFDAQKYTKAIDNIIKVRKVHAVNLAAYRIHEQNFKEQKDKAARVERQSQALHVEVEKLREQTKAMKVEIEAATQLAEEKHAQKNSAYAIVTKLESKRSQANNFEYTLSSLKDNLVELEESDEWLQTTLDQYQTKMAEMQEQASEYQKQYQQLQQALKKSQREKSDKQLEQGQYEAQKDTYERQLVERANLVNEAAVAHKMRGYDGDLEEEQIREFVKRVRGLSREKDLELDNIRSATQDDLKKIQGTLTELENRQATRKQERINAKQAITANDKRIKLRQIDVNSIRVNDGAKATLDSSFGDVQERLEKANSDYESAAWDKKIKGEKNSLLELEQESETLRQELFQSNKLATDRAALELAKKNLREYRQAMDTMVETHKKQLSDVVGTSWTPENLERAFQTALNQRSETLADLKAQRDSAEQKMKQTEYELKSTRANLTKKSDELKKTQARVLGAIETSDGKPVTSLETFLTEYECLEQERADIRKDLDGMGFVTDYYQKSMDVAKNTNCCRMCERKFADSKEKSFVVNKLEKQIQKLVKETLEQDLITNEQELKKAIEVRPLYDVCKKLADVEIPALEKEFKRLEGEKTTRVTTCTQHDRLVSDEESAKRDIEALTSTVNDITRYRSEISKHDQDITRLSSQQTQSGSSLSLDEIQEQSRLCSNKIRDLKVKIEDLLNKKDGAKVEISNLEKELSSVQTQLASAKNDLEKKQGLLATMEELREDNNKQRSIMQDADNDLEEAEPLSAKARAQYEDIERRGQLKAKQVQAEKDKLSRTEDKFKVIEDAINAYIEEDGPGKLAAAQRSIKAMDKDQNRIDKDIQEVTKNHNEMKTLIADSDGTKRSIQDNIRYRRTLRDLESVRQDIAELETHNADEDYAEFSREALIADKRRENLAAERGPLIGTMRSKDQELEQKMIEWETDYKDSANNYREMHIKHETTKAAIEDMLKCQRALDNAIMKFHSVKMEEINAIAGELWRDTYQGTDVDTIMIKSENESSTTSTRRNFNYRVVMIKQDAEMDMRGRCSAGQKVLASIIIRLALAECFGVNCGVIALDEPTTNLDEENIKALAGSLNQIIKSRKHQANFQLIIITHDESFLREMKCNEFTETYFRVARNAKQKSTIERQSMLDIMG